MINRVLISISLLFIPFSSFAQNNTLDNAYDLFSNGNLEEALLIFNSIEKYNEANATFYFLRGSCQSEIGNNKAAIKDLTISISLDNSNSNAYYQRGFSYFASGYSQKALQDFDQTIALDSQYREAYLNRGSVHYDLRNQKEACEDFKIAIKLGLTLAQSLVDQLCK